MAIPEEEDALRRLDPSPSPAKPCDVLLVSMPFAPLLQPSLGLSLLKGALADRPVRAEIRYFTLPFAAIVGADPYMTIAGGTPATSDLIGEWIFSPALFPGERPGDEEYVERLLRGPRPDLLADGPQHQADMTDERLAEIAAARLAAVPFVERCADEVVARAPRILGFTSVFQQHVASLALATAVRARLPDTFIVFGGANCESEMGLELLRQFPFVDAVVSGEGERVFPQLVDRVLAGEACDDIQGVATQHTADAPPRSAPIILNLDALPCPDYRDYFAQLEAAALDTEQAPRVLFESSRGCWWGAKHHCTFCGLNGTTLTFRSKSAERAFEEISSLARRHPGLEISVVDNILDMKYLKDFIPMLKCSELGLDLFYEVKANLKREQLLALRDAGIRAIQPGIESLSTDVLSLMDKGVRGLQNVQLLKWCKELGVKSYWNMLWGFPGEDPGEYAAMAEMLPALVHLEPPVAGCGIRLDRFSPNFDQAAARGFANVRPFASYGYIYDLPPEALARMAYHFQFDYAEPQPVIEYTRALADEIERWQAVHSESELFSVDADDRLLICDLRPVAVEPLTVLTGTQRALYLACDSARSAAQLRDTLSADAARPLTAEEVDRLVQDLVERRLMLRDGGLCLSLAVPVGEYCPPEWALARFREMRAEAERGDSAPIELATSALLAV